jgi:hypothetical protein
VLATWEVTGDSLSAGQRGSFARNFGRGWGGTGMQSAAYGGGGAESDRYRPGRDFITMQSD